MELEILHNLHGDKKRQFDTGTEKGRQELAVVLNRLMKGGTAIFLERGKKTYRVKAYDPKADMLTVDADNGKPVKATGRKGKTTAVAPVRGGC